MSAVKPATIEVGHLPEGRPSEVPGGPVSRPETAALPGLLVVPFAHAQAIWQAALTTYPKEACGFLRSDGYFDMENVAKNPLHNFAMDGEASWPVFSGGELRAVVHSHPATLAVPSEVDFDQMDERFVYLILSLRFSSYARSDRFRAWFRRGDCLYEVSVRAA